MVDILITHGPPRGILDCSPGAAEHAGCLELSNVVTHLGPKLHVFGHIHGAHWIVSSERTLFVNAALLGLDGELSATAIVIRIPQI
jgi:Icc-related predicted phosphoesterase